jgi:hypothetical protein
VVIYPAILPCVSRIERHAASADAGLVQTLMEAGNARQRRVQRALPQQVSLVFVISQDVYGDWLAWVNANAWDEWVVMRLPGLRASTAGIDTAPTAVRFMSDLQSELLSIDRLWIWRVQVVAEYLPAAADFIAITGVWIVPGQPAAPESDWVVGGSPDRPAPVFTDPGTPQRPTVVV